MKKNSWIIFLAGFALVSLLLACSKDTIPLSDLPSTVISPTFTATNTLLPTALPTLTVTPSLTPAPTLTLTPTSQTWALEGTPLPPSLMPISQENAAKVSALADWMTDPVIDLAWAPNVYQLVVAHPASIVFYDLANRAKLRQLYPQAAEIVDIDFSPDGKWLVSGSSRLSGDDLYTSNLELWVGPDWKPLGILYGQQGGLTGLGFSQNSQEFLVSYTLPEPEQSGWVDFWRVPAWKIANRLETGTILAFAASSQVSRLATTPNRYSIIIWDMEKRQLLFNLFTSFTGAVHRMVFSPDRILLATGHYDGNIRLWDALSGVLLLEIKNEGVIDSLAFTPDGSVLVAGLSGSEPVILLYSSSTGQLLNQLKGHASAVTSLLFSPDGQLFASGSYDGEIRLWGIRP